MKKILLMALLIFPAITFAKISEKNINDLEMEKFNYFGASMNKTYLEEEEYIILLAEQGIYRYDKKTTELTSVSFGKWDTTIVPFYENYLTISRIYDSEKGENYNKLTVIDSNLNVVQQKDVDLEGDYYYYGALYKDGDTIYLSAQNSKNYYIVDKDLNITLAQTTPSISEKEQLTTDFTSLIAKEDSSLSLYSVEKNEFDGYFAIVTQKYEDNTKLKVELREYNINKELVNSKTLYDDTYTEQTYQSISITYKKVKLEDYYIESYTLDNAINVNIYDANNELIKTIDLKKDLIEQIEAELDNNQTVSADDISLGDIIAILPTDNGFVLISTTFTTDYPLTSTIPDSKGVVGTTFFLKYGFDYIIDTKTDGNGEITSEKVEAGKGEEIKFTVTPKEGYVLGAVKVTDSEGNVVIFTDYTFTMPSSDVLIEATFISKNPDTTSMNLFITYSLLIIVLGAYLTIISIKKVSWINK